MQWIIDNWLLLALGGGMIAMHLFGHGHGGHGGHGKNGHDGKNENVRTDEDAPEGEDQPPDRRA